MRTTIKKRPGELAAWQEFRLDARKSYEKLPWPVPSENEFWRRTDVSHLNLEQYDIPPITQSESLQALDVGDDFSGRLRFSGTRLVAAGLDTRLAQQGVVFSGLQQAPELVAALLGKSAIVPSIGKFQALNSAYFTHGYVLFVPAWLELKKPFEIEFSEKGSDSASHPRILIVLDEGARAQVVQTERSSDSGALFRNSVVEILLARASALDLTVFQEMNAATLNFVHGTVEIAGDATFNSLNAQFGSKLTKSDSAVRLKEPGAHAILNGIGFATGHQHFDQRTVQYHDAPNTKSSLRYKTAVKDTAYSVYQGMIRVEPGGQQVDAYQANQNLLLNDGARADSIPSLEIEANNLKCSHGTTVGKVDEEQVYYLMTRGLSREEAKRFIISGFFEEVFKEAPEKIQVILRQLIEQKLNQNMENAHVG